MNEANITIEQMAEILGGPAPVTEPVTPPAAEPVTPAVAEPVAPPVTEPVTPPVTEPVVPPVTEPAIDPTVQLQQNKAQEAFANLRIQNKQMNDTLKGVAGLLGIEGAVESDAIMSALQAKILEKQAQTQNVPVELLQRLQTQEQQLTQFTAQQRQRNIEAGFEAVKTEYKLDATQMSKFADDLIAHGMNPFTTDVDLPRAYKDLHFDEIIAAKVQEAVTAEQARAAAATANGSNPGSQQGGQQQGDNITKVNSVRELNAWFAQELSK